jgi:hypothetical protein
MGFNNKFKTNSFAFWSISKIIEIVDGVYVGHLTYITPKSDESAHKFIFVLKVSRNSSFLMETGSFTNNSTIFINRMGSLIALPVAIAL